MSNGITAATASENQSLDFALEKYKLDRDHELELNRATAAYEHSVVRTLFVLNGGSVVAFLTLLGALSKDGPRPHFGFWASALAVWMLGLIVTAYGTDVARRMQRGYAKAFRLRRQAEELRRFGEGEWERLGVDQGTGPSDLDQKATAERNEAGRHADRAQFLGRLAGTLFPVGVLLAAFSVSPWFAIEREKAETAARDGAAEPVRADPRAVRQRAPP